MIGIGSINYPIYVEDTVMDFDGVDDHLDCGDIGDFDQLDPFSVGGWFKISGNGNYTFMSRMINSTSAGWLAYMGTGKLIIISIICRILLCFFQYPYPFSY